MPKGGQDSAAVDTCHQRGRFGTCTGMSQRPQPSCALCPRRAAWLWRDAVRCSQASEHRRSLTSWGSVEPSVSSLLDLGLEGRVHDHGDLGEPRCLTSGRRPPTNAQVPSSRRRSERVRPPCRPRGPSRTGAPSAAPVRRDRRSHARPTYQRRPAAPARPPQRPSVLPRTPGSRSPSAARRHPRGSSAPRAARATCPHRARGERRGPGLHTGELVPRCWPAPADVRGRSWGRSRPRDLPEAAPPSARRSRGDVRGDIRGDAPTAGCRHG